MKLSKTSNAIILASSIGLITHTAPLFADSEDSCQQRGYGKGHFTMMGQHGPGNKNPEKMIEKISRKLDLSDEQREQAYAKLNEITPRIKEKRQAIHEGMKRLHEIDPDADDFESSLQTIANEQGQLVADMILLQASMHIELEQLLTDEQKAQFDKMKQKRGKHWHGDQSQS